jgi:DNA ligase D
MAAPKTPALELDVEGRLVRVSNPDKVYFSTRGETKLDLVNYYLSVESGIVRALWQRPCTLQRFPDGVEGESIYQKRVPEHRPEWVQSARVTFPSGRHADELCVTEVASVAWAANLGTVVFHPWPSRRDDVEHPDEMRIDLDPQPGTSFSHAQAVAVVVHELLDELGYLGFPKTSGGRGIHIYVRLQPLWTFTEIRRAVLAFSREVERRMPADVTTKWWKEERGEKIFMDYNQNARDRTIAAAYSVRARPEATVSTPVTWAELADVDPMDFTIATVPARFAAIGDLHTGIDDVAHDLSALVEMADRDERDLHLEDAPYPPNFPKMEGEPARVAPSRARKPKVQPSATPDDAG